MVVEAYMDLEGTASFMCVFQSERFKAQSLITTYNEVLRNSSSTTSVGCRDFLRAEELVCRNFQIEGQCDRLGEKPIGLSDDRNSFTWDWQNLPMLSCPQSCLVSALLTNASALGFRSDDSCRRFRGLVGYPRVGLSGCCCPDLWC